MEILYISVIFCLASWGAHKDTVELLIKNNANIEDKDKKGWTALMHGRDWIVYFCILLVSIFYFLIIFCLASSNGHKDVVELLIKNGANVNETNNDGWIALMYGHE